jgi:hypothetical protein
MIQHGMLEFSLKWHQFEIMYGMIKIKIDYRMLEKMELLELL